MTPPVTVVIVVPLVRTISGVRTSMGALSTTRRRPMICPVCEGNGPPTDDCRCGHAVENHNLDIYDDGLDFCSRCDCQRWRRIPCPRCNGSGTVSGFSPAAVQAAQTSIMHLGILWGLFDDQEPEDWQSAKEVAQAALAAAWAHDFGNPT